MSHKQHSNHPDPAAAGSTSSFAHHPATNPEKSFRWRGGEITRLEAFCDVVFGFALTLLVVSLEVPHSYSELIADMRGFLPFAVCFSQLVMIWVTHYRFSRRYGLQDSYTVLLYVYPLKFVFTLVISEVTGGDLGRDLTFQNASTLMQIYAIGFGLVFLLFVLLYAHAYALRDKLELNKVELHETKMSMQSNAILALIGFASLLIAFRSPAWAGWSFMLIGPALTLHGSLVGRKVRKLEPNA